MLLEVTDTFMEECRALGSDPSWRVRPPSLNRPLNCPRTIRKFVIQTRYDETVGSCHLSWHALPIPGIILPSCHSCWH